jgi:hypothetical protein
VSILFTHSDVIIGERNVKMVLIIGIAFIYNEKKYNKHDKDQEGHVGV